MYTYINTYMTTYLQYTTYTHALHTCISYIDTDITDIHAYIHAYMHYIHSLHTQIYAYIHTCVHFHTSHYFTLQYIKLNYSILRYITLEPGWKEEQEKEQRR